MVCTPTRRPTCRVAKTPTVPTGAPGFYSVYRLLQVTTQVRNNNGSGMRNVRWFRLNHQFPTAPNEGNESAKSGRKLWLASIDPGDENPVVYHGGWRDNRVNHPNGVSRMQALRITKVVNESGGYVNFTYGQSHAPQTDSCSTSNTSNIRRGCDMYVAWDAHTGSGGWVWWHKWKITKTVEGAGNGQGGSAEITNTYSYPKTAGVGLRREDRNGCSSRVAVPVRLRLQRVE